MRCSGPNPNVTQLTNNSYYDVDPRIHNGQVVWYGYDGNDTEVFYHDATTAYQVTDNDYADAYPVIAI